MNGDAHEGPIVRSSPPFRERFLVYAFLLPTYCAFVSGVLLALSCRVTTETPVEALLVGVVMV